MKEKIYIIFKNNEEEYDDYCDWITEIHLDKEKAEKRFVELVKTNQYKKDRAIKRAKYNEDIGAYRIEEHEIENETNKVIDTNASSIEEDIKKQKESLRNWLAMHVLIKENSYMRFNYEDCWNLYKFVENALIKSDDYKRVLKENEEKTTILLAGAEKVKQLEKENRKLKEDRNNNNEMVALARNEVLNYMTGYEDGKKHKMTATAQVVENQQYYIIQKQMEKYEEHIKRLKKENEKLKFEERGIIIGKYEDVEINDVINRTLSNDYISKQIIKDKIEELNSRIEKYREYIEQGIETDVEWVDNVADRETVKVLQELLESEDSKDGEN